MPVLLSLRSIESEADNVKNTFSSWDSCMSEAYCKWPVIVAIIIASLILLSLIWCCARCLCCGAECCCGCLSCFNRCCPSPRSKSNGYQRQQYPPNTQYQSPAPPMYFGGGGGYMPAQTATFDAPGANKKYNEDALPAMPSWNTAQSRRVEEEGDVEMEKLDQHTPPQQQGLLHQRNASADYDDYSGDVGTMQAGPYNDYSQHQEGSAQAAPYAGYSQPANGYAQQQSSNTQANPYNSYSQRRPTNTQPTQYNDYSQHNDEYIGSPVSTAAPSIYPPTYHTQPVSPVYESQNANPYGAPPTYRTAPPTIASPPAQHARMPSAGSYAIGRKPVSGSWRDE